MFVRIYSGEDGQSYFEDLDASQAPLPLEPSADISIRSTPAGSFYDWHLSDERRYAFVMSGELEVVIGDGTVRRFGPGTVILAEDSTGRGHTTRIGAEPCVVVNLMLPG